jgi:transposase
VAFLTAQVSGKQLYIFQVKSFRNDKNKPDNKKICVGKVSKETYKPIYKPSFLTDLSDGKALVSRDNFDEFNKIDFMSILVNKNIIDASKCNNNIVNNVNNNNSKTINYFNSTKMLDKEVFDSIKDWGTPYFFAQIAKKVDLYNILKPIFGSLISMQLLLVAIYLAVSKDAFMHCYKWVDEIDISINNSLSSQRISALLKNITYTQRCEFYEQWFKYINNDEPIALDITSISSYSKNIHESEYGHNRDNENLPQINICMLFGEHSLLPIYQTVYHGSLNDVSTLYCTINELSAVSNGTKFIITMDKGFFSESNIDIMVDKKIGRGFIIGTPFTNNLVVGLIDKHRNIDQNPNNLVDKSRNSLFGITEEIIYGTKKHKLFAHIYFNPTKYLIKKEQLLDDITSLKRLINENRKLSKSNKKEIEKYLTIYFDDDNNKKIRTNTMVFDNELKFAGWYILISDTITDVEEANRIYRTKDVVEKSFNNIKNRLLLNRIRVHSSDRMQNKLFISFISLILISLVYKYMKKNDLYKKYTLNDIFDKTKLLKKIKINNCAIYRPIAKEIKDIFKYCEINVPKFDKEDFNDQIDYF